MLRLVALLALISQLAIGAHYSTGLRLPKDWDKNATFHAFEVVDALPDTFDWSKELGNATPEVFDQKSCGSCWAAAGAKVIQFLVAIKTKKSAVPLSVQELVSCDKKNYGCNGGMVPFDYVINPGLASESDFPYVGKNSKCKSGLNHIEKVISWGYVGAKGQRPTTEQIKSAIFQYGPVWAGVSADNAFMNWKPGAPFKNCHSNQLNHAIVLYGWTSKGWLLWNSWGEKWGDHGHMEITFGCNGVGNPAAFAVLP